MNLILSIFPGIDSLGRGFEEEGFCVVRGPDLLWGGDIHRFHPPADRFDGVIGGSPCQDFSLARRSPPTGQGVKLLAEFARVVKEATPDWFLLENVPGVPSLEVEGYSMQRLNLRASECGGTQRRNRCFQFGSRDGRKLAIDRQPQTVTNQACALASEGKYRHRRSFADFCEAQGLPRDFDLPGYSIAAKYKAVGNGVHVGVAQTIARAIRDAPASPNPRAFTLCACDCGRAISGRQVTATAGCRKRMQRKRDGSSIQSSGSVTVTVPGIDRAAESQRKNQRRAKI